MSEYAVRLANGTDTAPRVRLADALALQGNGPLATRSGLRPDGGGAVTAVDGSMTVQVTPFLAWIDGGVSDTQGGYPFVCDATKTLTVADGHTTLTRTDTVAAVVYDDAFDGSGQTAAELVVVQGTPGNGAPTLPTNSVPLRDITVPAGTSAGTGGLSSSNIGADRRQYLASGTVTVASAYERNNLGALAGQTVYRMDTGKLELYTGTAWQAFKPDDGLRVQAGTASLVVSGGKGQVRVTFPTPYNATPTVTASFVDGNPVDNVISLGAMSSTYVDIVMDGDNATYTVHWIAVGAS